MNGRHSIAEWFGPPWWRPFARRRWRRLTDATVGANHWSAVHAADADCMIGYIGPFAELVADRLSEELPDGLEVKWGSTEADGPGS